MAWFSDLIANLQGSGINGAAQDTGAAPDAGAPDMSALAGLAPPVQNNAPPQQMQTFSPPPAQAPQQQGGSLGQLAFNGSSPTANISPNQMSALGLMGAQMLANGGRGGLLGGQQSPYQIHPAVLQQMMMGRR